MEIRDKTALVTGSGQRIGRATVEELARRGARVAIHFRRSGDAARDLVGSLRERGADAECFQADLTGPGEPDRLVKSVLDRFGSLDILVNNASFFARGGLQETTEQLWDEHLDTNARSPFFLARAASRSMLERGCGKIVNLADPAGEAIWTGYLPYSVSKATLIAVTHGLARTLAPDIQVNAVAPGPVLFPKDYTDGQKQLAISRTLLKRAGSTRDVVSAIVFLIENDYITGDVLHVDGGRHLV